MNKMKNNRLNRLRLVMAIAFAAIFVTASPLMADTVDTDDHKAHDFNDNSLGPFSEDQGFTGSAIKDEGMSFQNDGQGGKRLKLTWKESEYDGTRRERGHEIKLGVNDNKDLFTGFYLNINSTQNNNILNKNTIIWQLYNWNTAGCSNWTAHLELRGSDLYLYYRNACVTPTIVKIKSNLPTDVSLAFQIRTKLSGNNKGKIIIYLDGKKIANEKNINLGFGSFDSDDIAETSVAGVKMGMYSSDTLLYDNDEIRTLYLDNVASARFTESVYKSFRRVDPRRSN